MSGDHDISAYSGMMDALGGEIAPPGTPPMLTITAPAAPALTAEPDPEEGTATDVSFNNRWGQTPLGTPSGGQIQPLAGTGTGVNIPPDLPPLSLVPAPGAAPGNSA